MATKLLDETRIRALHQAALDAGLAVHRADQVNRTPRSTPCPLKPDLLDP